MFSAESRAVSGSSRPHDDRQSRRSHGRSHAGDPGVDAVPVETLPSDWLSIRNRWEAFHAARMFVSLAGFGSPLAAALWSREDATPLV